MAKLIPDAIIDLELGVVAAATILFICKDTPTTYADAAGTYDLATHILTPAIGGGDFTSGAGDGSGRKLTLAAQNGITVDHNGTATYYVLGISATTTLLLIGTISSQVLTAGNLVNFPPTDVLEIGDVT
jgi:hypothetical protein